MNHLGMSLSARFSMCAAAAAIIFAATHSIRTETRCGHAAHHEPAPATGHEQAPIMSLKRVVETRWMDIAKPAEDGMFIMSSEKPSLTLTFSLRLPAGAKLMDVEQPTKVVAIDSAGTDLSKIEAGFRDEREYVDQVYDFDDDDDLSDLTLQLTPSSRAAQTFSVQTTFNASMFTGSRPVQIQASENWTSLEVDAADFSKPVRFRADEDGLTFQPSDIQKLIERIDLHLDGNETSSANGWFSDGTSITYMLDQVPEARPLKFTVMLRTGVKVVPLTIDVKDQPLP